MLIGKIIVSEEAGDWDVATTVRTIIKRVGDPVVWNAVSQAMRVLGRQFVLGRDISEAIKRSQDKGSKGYTHSYGMLGKTDYTAHDAGVPAGLFGTIDQVFVSDIKNAQDLAGVVLEQGAVDHRDVRMTLASRNGPILPLIENLVDWRGPC
jgi:hypothetical protein